MKRIGIVAKQGRAEPVEVLKDLIPYLKDRGYEVFIEKWAALELGIHGHTRDELPELIDLLIVLGGDGTMLSAARLVAEREIPLLGINLGGLGFITEINLSEMYDLLDDLLNERCIVEERMMIDASVFRGGKMLTHHTVLNDVVITKGALARIIDLKTTINRLYVSTFKADGLIIATPTGSTAYNLSAGGPILHPSMESFVITPICPHTLTNRPIVISCDSEISVNLESESEDVFLTLDGQVGLAIRRDDRVVIRKSPYRTKLLIPCERDYFQILREKLQWGKR
ncbi:MAG: NAD(+) kinase [Nitrospirae bacterium]|nr:MAG: NAD(+) kinase [Nitrospirota bacterium]